MLSRIGNSLFWMERYLERAEHIARYTRVQYVSSADFPLSQSRQFMLESILDMADNRQGYLNTQQQLDEEEVINYTAISEANPYSILGYINMVRENARGARDSISIELWEAINRFYHKLNKYTPNALRGEGVEIFANKVEENSYVTKGYIDNTLLRNEVWMLISLGIHLERAIQVIMILQTKMQELEKLDAAKQGSAFENYLWTSILLSTESFDMYMRCQKKSPNKHNVLNFLLFDTDFPKSVAYSLTCVRECLEDISFQEETKKESVHFKAGNLTCRFQFTTVEEIEDSASEFLASSLENIYEIANLLHVKYLNYK